MNKLMREAYEKWFCEEPLDNEHPYLAFEAGWKAALEHRNKHSTTIYLTKDEQERDFAKELDNRTDDEIESEHINFFQER